MKRPWPASLRSPLWLALFGLLGGTAVGWMLPEPAWVAGALGASGLAWWWVPRAAVPLFACSLGIYGMQHAALAGRPPEWRGSGCFVCTLDELPQQGKFGWRATARCRGGQTTRRVRLEGRGFAPRCIGRVRVWAQWHPWAITPRFDEHAIYGKRGLAGRLACVHLDWLEARDRLPSRVEQAMHRARSTLEKRLASTVSPSAFGLLWGISTGDKGKLTRVERDAFGRMGLAHVLAVSGYHVGLIGFIPLLLARSRRQSFRLFALLGIPLIAAYVHFCGDSDSAVRALGMASLLLLGACLRRPLPLAHAWCLTGWGMVVTDPLAALQLGTQLSFVAVLGIALGLEAVATFKGRRWLRPLAVPVAAQSATAPLAVPVFGQFPLAFLPVNLVAGPWVTALGFATMGWLLWPESLPGRTALGRGVNFLATHFVQWAQAGAKHDALVLTVSPLDHMRWWALSLGVMVAFIARIRRHQPSWLWAATALLASTPWWPLPASPRMDWNMPRSRQPALVLGKQVIWTDSLTDQHADTTGWVVSKHEGDSLKLWGVNALGSWSFACDLRHGLGALNVGEHRWVWERWHEETAGVWPKKNGDLSPRISIHSDQFK